MENSNNHQHQCLVEGCTRKCSRTRLCEFHLYPEKHLCRFAGCKKPRHLRGACRDHYQILRGQNLARPIKQDKSSSACQVPYCRNRAVRYGICIHHKATHFISTKAWRPSEVRPVAISVRCLNCDELALDGGLCERHSGGERCSLPECNKLAVDCDAHAQLDGTGSTGSTGSTASLAPSAEL